MASTMQQLRYTRNYSRARKNSGLHSLLVATIGSLIAAGMLLLFM